MFANLVRTIPQLIIIVISAFTSGTHTVQKDHTQLIYYTRMLLTVHYTVVHNLLIGILL